MEDRFAMDDLPLYPWVVSEKPNFVRIEPDRTTGRRFHTVEQELTAATTRGDREYHPGAPRRPTTAARWMRSRRPWPSKAIPCVPPSAQLS